MTRTAALLAAFGLAAAPAIASRPAPDPAAPVELQVSLCAPPATIARTLGLRPRGEPREVWLFDDAALSLYRRGLRLRLRTSAGGAELALKVADRDCARIPAGLVPPGEGKCEYDAHGTDVTGTVSVSARIDAQSAEDLVSGARSLAQALSPAQMRVLREQAGAWPLPDGIRALGPQRVELWRAADKPYDVDMTTLPNGARYVEISRRVSMAELATARALLDRDLAEAKIDLCADQSAQAINKLQALLAAPRR